MATLDQQIHKAIFGGEPDKGDPTKVKVAAVRKDPGTVTEAEKIATTLEFIGRRGVANMVKGAESHTPVAKAPPGTNQDVDHGSHQQKTVKPHKGAPPMELKRTGEADHTLHQRPGGSAEQAKPRGDGQTHHPSLASSSAAIVFDKREKAKQVDSDLSALFDAKPFADGKLKENLTGAAEKGDKNIHVKSAADKERIKAAIARKRAMQES
tara:strand:+ start:462 stop:1091 length:630 start_codon:yes stop_codon:yes gene_type:complete